MTRQRLAAALDRLLILDELQQGSNVSQRALASRLGMAVGAINRHLHDMIDAGYIKVPNRSVRPFAYKLTGHGKEYCRQLTHEHYRRVLGSLRVVEQRIGSALRNLKRRGASRVVFYGAGEVMEATYRVADGVGLKVVGVVDDDASKQGLRKGGLVVEPPSAINKLKPDAVLITTFRHAGEIRLKLDPALRSSVEVWEL